MNRNEKKELVNILTEKFKQSSALYFTKYTGMNVAQATELRFKFKDQKVDFFISKNTLTKLAIKEAGMDENSFDDFLLGQVGIAYANEDPTSPAKVIKEFNKSNDCLEVLGMYFDGEVFSSDKFNEFASLPSKEELLTSIACVLNSSMTKVAYCLQSSMSNMANVLNNLKEQKNK